jgi:hypothetical protein
MAGWTCAACTTTYAVGAAKCPHCGSTERTDQPGGAVLPSVTVACANDVCRYAGRQRRVHLRTAAPGVLEMPPLICAGCGLQVPTVAPWPPINEPEDEDMAKITVHGGPSDALAGLADGEHVLAADAVEAAAEASEEPAVESDGEAAVEEPEKAPRQRRARGK